LSLKIGPRKDTKDETLWITGTVHGRRVRRSTGTADKRVAREIANEIERRIIREELYGPESVITFAQACVAYVEGGGSRDFLAKIVLHLGEKFLLKDMTPGLARQIALKLYPSAKASTQNRQVIVPIGAVVNSAHKAGLGTAITMDRFQEDAVSRPHADVDWLIAFREACGDRLHLRALVSFMFCTGARVTSALNVTPDDMKLGECTILLRETKNGKPHETIVPSWLAEEIAALEPVEDRVFSYSKRGSLQDPIKAVCERAGIERLTTHEFGRHAFGKLAGDILKDSGEAAKAGGWESSELYARKYRHADDKRRQLAAEIGAMIDTPLTREPLTTKLSDIKQNVEK